jgi:hypothetical protein
MVRKRGEREREREKRRKRGRGEREREKEIKEGKRTFQLHNGQRSCNFPVHLYCWIFGTICNGKKERRREEGEREKKKERKRGREGEKEIKEGERTFQLHSCNFPVHLYCWIFGINLQ